MQLDLRALLKQLVPCLIVAAITGGLVYWYCRVPQPEPAPTAIIDGPRSGSIGSLLEYTVDGSRGDGFFWVVPSVDSDWRKWPDGRKILGTFRRPGKYEIGLVSIAAQGGQYSTATTSHVVTIDAPGPEPPGPQPGPGPGPGPGPEPTPPLPPGRFNLAAQARDWAALVKLPAADRVRTAQLVAGSFESVASAIAAGAARSIADALEKLISANKSVLTQSEYEAWKADWNPKFQTAMTQLDDAGKLPALADVADAFLEIAQGLRAAR
jgi:hypothetical protein